jgi:hypothetical protein
LQSSIQSKPIISGIDSLSILNKNLLLPFFISKLSLQYLIFNCDARILYVIMFRLKNSENLARFLYHKTLHNNNPMAYSIGYYVDPCSHLSKVYANVFDFGVNRRFEFGRKTCGFYTSASNSSRPRGFASDLEQGNSVKVDNDIGGLNGSSATPRFRDQRLSEKLVVAVDVDEGMYVCMHAIEYFLI